MRPWLPWADAAFVLLIVIDAWRTPNPNRLAVDRSLPSTVGLSKEIRRTLQVSLATAVERGGRLVLEVDEEFPAPFQVLARTLDGELVGTESEDPSGGPDRGELAGSGSLVLTRLYRSDLRGTFALGDLRLRLRSPWGLIERVTRLAGEQRIAVEPALANLRQTLRLAASERWQDLGVRLVRRRGGETEFESLREYVSGDDVRRVDWKAFARRAKPMVRQYQVERGQELFLLIDRGRRMRIATATGKRRGWTKLDWALDAALELAAVALAKGDRVGAAAFDRGLLSFVTPAKSSTQLRRLSNALFDVQPSDHDSDLGRALRELAARHRRRATVVVISDVADPYSVEMQSRDLAQASGRHRLVFAALDDPGLRAAVEGDAPTAAVRAAAFDLVEDRHRALRSLATSGARVVDALPAEAAAPMLAAWLEERRG